MVSVGVKCTKRFPILYIWGWNGQIDNIISFHPVPGRPVVTVGEVKLLKCPPKQSSSHHGSPMFHTL